MLLHLEREYWPGGTNGTIRVEGFRICHTVEQPWNRNSPNSCIPEGISQLHREYNEQWGWHLFIRDASGRGTVRILPESVPSGKEPKISPVCKLTGEGKGTQSKLAFEKFKEFVYSIIDQNENAMLEIRSFPDAALNLVQFERAWMD